MPRCLICALGRVQDDLVTSDLHMIDSKHGLPSPHVLSNIRVTYDTPSYLF